MNVSCANSRIPLFIMENKENKIAKTFNAFDKNVKNIPIQFKTKRTVSTNVKAKNEAWYSISNIIHTESIKTNVIKKCSVTVSEFILFLVVHILSPIILSIFHRNLSSNLVDSLIHLLLCRSNDNT